MLDKVVKRDGRVVPFDRDKVTFAVLQAAVSVGGRDRGTAEKVADDVIGLLGCRQKRDSYPTVEEVQDLVEKALIERGHARTAKAYIVYRYEHALKRAGKKSLTYSSDNIPYAKLWETLSWAVDHRCVSLAQISEIITEGRYAQLIEDSESFYQHELDQAYEKLHQRLKDIRIIIIAGPSSSGKTTTTIKIGDKLHQEGYALKPINVDNYFLNLEDHPQDSRGDFDFETPQALDLEQINQDLMALLEGGTVDVPFYNFKTGQREGISETVKIEGKQIILIDSLHGLFPEMMSGIAEERKFKLYIETLSQIKDARGRFLRWADIRLLRRMVRDMQFRNYTPTQTIRHWHFVRRSELRYIVPRLLDADALVNSFLPYELPIMRHRLGQYFPEFVEKFAQDPEREDALTRAVRVQQIFDEIPEWPDAGLVPDTSLLREFIGGSIYQY
jgi:uridine kinase